jgi:non-ribosomal peptide synthetase component E (peptide arylation enzyme)
MNFNPQMETWANIQKGAWVINSLKQNQDSFTDDGWFKTGDVSTIDQDGYMEIKVQRTL